MTGERFDQSLLPLLNNSFTPEDYVGIKVMFMLCFFLSCLDLNVKLADSHYSPDYSKLRHTDPS
ncbi:hypothetical protein HOLleu_44750 [Holothuria leucospilota]|uniref:Uncharacterized protein n=1 Tax=Holothuria leucospilota TaxID=206669 RepID=A0A9Q1BA97_HOLLE|nr:hypothetical protein HOLleu_44750 [Holothuria leucospilota]